MKECMSDGRDSVLFRGLSPRLGTCAPHRVYRYRPQSVFGVSESRVGSLGWVAGWLVVTESNRQEAC